MKIHGFLSYSRKDIEVAKWLHKKIEKYPYPADLVDDEHRPPHDTFVRRIFIDKTDMYIEDRGFTETIKDALTEAKYLILLCSENSAKSDFVDKEIKYFLKTHNNDYSLIVPLFIDKVDNSIPPAILGTSIMERHFPIYDSNLSAKSEANLYCFYQLIAFMLGLDFNVVYDRYEQYSLRKQKREKRRMRIFLALLVGVIGLLSYNVYETLQKLKQEHQLLETEQALTKFEKDVFPAALVFGYQENFLSPVIDYLDSIDSKYTFYILLPRSASSLENQQQRFVDFKQELKDRIGLDSLTVVHLNTRMKRGSQVSRMCFSNAECGDVYIDFASTTSAFLKIAKYKKENEAYSEIPIDSIISDYSKTFIAKTKELMGDKADKVLFFANADEFIDDITRRFNIQYTVR